MENKQHQHIKALEDLGAEEVTLTPHEILPGYKEINVKVVGAQFLHDIESYILENFTRYMSICGVDDVFVITFCVWRWHYA